jgi:hypothetical protein
MVASSEAKVSDAAQDCAAPFAYANQRLDGVGEVRVGSHLEGSEADPPARLEPVALSPATRHCRASRSVQEQPCLLGPLLLGRSVDAVSLYMNHGEVSLMKKPGRSYPLPALRPRRTYPVICLMPRSGSILIYRLRRAARGDQGAALERLDDIFAIEHPFNTRHDH